MVWKFKFLLCASCLDDDYLHNGNVKHANVKPANNSPMSSLDPDDAEILQWILTQLQSFFPIPNLQTISFHFNHSSSSSTCCTRDNETSISITLSTPDFPLFPTLLTELSTSTPTVTTTTTLKNFEFHSIEWYLDDFHPLASLMTNSTNVTQLTFHKNRFHPDCLCELSDFLKINAPRVKSVTFSESRIGPYGAGLLASALTVNHNVEEVLIWEDSIGPKGVEELSKMIEVNPSLKLLTLFDTNYPNTAAPLVSPALARNRALEVHAWAGKPTNNSIKKVVELVPETGTLIVYRTDLVGACRIACAMGVNTTVKYLDMSGIRLRSKWAREFRYTLEQNRTLQKVTLSNCKLKDNGVIYIAAGLFKNKRLESLILNGNSFTAVGLEHLLTPLSRFSSLQLQANTALKSVVFGGGGMKIGRNGVTAIVKMIMTNQTLKHVGIEDDKSLTSEEFVDILKGVEKNDGSLKRLSLRGCRGVSGDRVLNAVMEMLEVNTWIEEVELERTPLDIAGECERVYEKLGQRQKTIEEGEVEIDSFKDMPLISPKSCRIFLCGQDNAGKSTLDNVMSCNFSSTTKQQMPYIEHVRTLVNPIEQAVKIEIARIKTKTFNFKDDHDTSFSIWNLTGQVHDLFSLHDFMFPGHGSGSASIFLIVSSMIRKSSNKEAKTSEEIEEDIYYWLRFILSNSRRSSGQQCVISPGVVIVLTHYDRINQSSGDLSVSLTAAIQRLKEMFQGLVEFHPTVFTIDARSPASVGTLNQHIRLMSRNVLDRIPMVYELCNSVKRMLSEWRSENHNKPTISLIEYGQLCQVKVPALRVVSSQNSNKQKTEKRRRVIARTLHQLGELIYFDEVNVLVLNNEWFCDEVLGQIVKVLSSKGKGLSKDGFVSRKEVEKLFLRGNNLHSQIPGMVGGSTAKVFEELGGLDAVAKLMVKLEFTFEQDAADSDSPVLVPLLLEDRRHKPQRWQFATHECVYAGRHLECDDHALLLPSFFPRLQVNLHNKMMKLKNQHGATCNLEKHLILLNINGINIRIEFNVGKPDHHIDILACSSKTLTETLRLFHQLIMPAIHTICSHQGGIILNESIIRPECVRNLTPPRHRKTQLLPVHKLRQALLSVPAESMYEYRHTWCSVADDSSATGSSTSILTAGFDLARDLLSDDDFREVLQIRYNDLYNLATELEIPQQNNPITAQNEMSVDPSIDGIAKGVERVLQRLKIIEDEIRDIKQEIQGLRYYEHRLLIELFRKLDHLVNYNVQVEERKAPNLFFFVRTDNYSRKLITTIIPGMCALRLHMLCEFRREIHVVEDQLGCEVMRIDNVAVRSVAPYMTGFMKMLTFALKVGAHLAAGMGEMIPDLGREMVKLTGSGSGSAMMGVAAVGAVGAVMGVTGRRTGQNVQEEQRAAQQWVLDFLRDRECASGKDIAEKFGLWRVRYRDTGQIAWVCRRHLSLRAHEVVEVPI